MKYKIIILLIVIIASTTLVYAQNTLPVSWAVSAGGSLNDNANDIAIDRSGNIYVLGSFEGLVSFGSFELQSSGGYDLLLIKYNSDGEVIWAKRAGGQGYDAGLSITIDNLENILITGTYDYYAQFESLYAEGHLADIFVAKYSPDGEPVWVKSGGGEANDASFGITTDQLNNVIITGVLQGPANFDSVFTGSSRFADIFTAKYDTRGNILWLRTAGDTDYDAGFAVATNKNNEIFVTGSFSGSVFFGNRFDILNSNGGQDIFIVKYDADGNFVWSRSVGGPNYDNGSDLQIGINGGILLTGTYSDSVSFGKITLPGIGYSDMFVAKYDQDSGEPIWVNHEGEVTTNYDASDITSDSDGNISLVGRITGSQLINSIFIAKYTTDGNKSGDYSLVSPYSLNSTGIAYNSSGDLLFTGSFSGELTLGTITLKNNGAQDIFLTELIFPVLQFNTLEIIFDQQAIGEPSRQSLFIENTSDALLSINDLQVSGPDAASFIFLSNPSFVINANSSAEIPVEFTPERPGLSEAYLIIISNATSSPDTILLTGTGVLKSPLISIESLNFGNVILGNTLIKPISISNPNNIPINIEVAISPEVGDFKILPFNPTISALGNIDIDVEFSPVDNGERLAELIIYGEEFSDSLRVNLQGRGDIPALNLSANSVNLGRIDVNNPSETLVNVDNNGPVNVIISRVNFSGTDAAEFRLVNTPVPDTVSPGENKSFRIRLTPLSTGEKSAQMLIFSNTYNSPDTIRLRATAEIRALSFSADSLDFGNLYVNTPVIKEFTLTNNNITNVIISGCEITGDAAEEFTLINTFLPDTIKPNQIKEFNIRLNPVSSGEKTAQLVVYSNSSGSPDSLPLKGVAIVPSLTYSTDNVKFGNSAVNGNLDKTINVFNGSRTQIIIDDAVFVGTNWIEFTLINTPLPDTLNANESKDFTIRLTPSNSGSKSAYLVVISNSSESPDSILLTATAFISPLTLSDVLTDFGVVDVDGSVSKLIKIINPGPSTVIVNSINITGIDRSDFSVANASVPDTLKALEEKSVLLDFAPKVSGIKNAALIILSNSVSSPDSVELTGSALSLVIVQSEETDIGQSAILNVKPPPGFNFNDNTIFFRRSGEKSFNSADLVFSEEGYIANIPAEYSTIRGIEYYIVFSDGINIVTFPVNDPQNHPAVLSTKIPRIDYPLTLGSSVYQMISVPLSLTVSQIDSVLSDDYGTYDKSIWRIFRWDQNQNDYQEYPDLGKNLSPGNAFWLIHRDAKVFDLENASSITSDRPFLINLESGWNQIGNPFPFAVAWDSIGNSQSVQVPIFWNPETNDYELDQNILQSWTGYWIFNPSEALTLSVEPIEAASVGKRQSGIITGEGEFIVQVSVGNLNGEQDAQNFIGMLKDAVQGYDRYDILEPPPIVNNLRLSVIRNNNRYAKDFVAVSGEGSFWDLRLNDLSGKEINMTFENKTPLPEGFKVWLLDLDKMITVPVQENRTSIFLVNKTTGNFRLIVGTEKYAEDNSEKITLIPLEYSLFQNYPNPFNPSTTISYQLCEKSSVTLEIFDVLGKKIVSLLENELQNPGIHNYTWNAFNITSGMYIYRIKANSFIAAKSMLLLK